VNLFFFLRCLSFFVLSLVRVKSLKHFSELLNLCFIRRFDLWLLCDFLFLFIILIWRTGLSSGLSEFLDGLVFLSIRLLQFFIFYSDFTNFVLNGAQMLIKLIDLLIRLWFNLLFLSLWVCSLSLLVCSLSLLVYSLTRLLSLLSHFLYRLSLLLHCLWLLFGSKYNWRLLILDRFCFKWVSRFNALRSDFLIKRHLSSFMHLWLLLWELSWHLLSFLSLRHFGFFEFFRSLWSIWQSL